MSRQFVMTASDDVSGKIKELATEREVSKGDIMKRALELYFLMDKELKVNDERRIAIVEGNKIIDRYVLV